MDLDYKLMPDNELKKIVATIGQTAQELMDEISALKNLSHSFEWQGRRDLLVQKYAKLKELLKTIYHYISLTKNDVVGQNYYKAFFCPTIRDCYLACHAKANESNLDALFSSLWEIHSEVMWHTPDDED